VPELGSLGSVRGALSNELLYRDLRNPLGSKSAGVAAGSSGDVAETAQQRLFAFELLGGGYAAATGFRLALPARRLAQHNGGAVQYAQLVGFGLVKSQRK
jgi:hypothetical protein